MSFSHLLQLSGRQLENFNNTQKALENLNKTSSVQQQQKFQINEQKKPGGQFGNLESPSLAAGDSNNVFASNIQNGLLTKQVSFSENSAFKVESADSTAQIAQQERKLQLQPQRIQNMTFQGGEGLTLKEGSFGQDHEDAISDLVQHSDKTIRQLEDQFKSLNLGTTGSNLRGFSYDKNNSSVGNINGRKISHIKSEVDRVIMQAEMQNKLSNQGLQNRESKHTSIGSYESKRRDFSGNRKEMAQLSPNEKKKSKSQKKHSRHSKQSKKGKRADSSDDTSSYSSQSDSNNRKDHHRDNQSSSEDSSYEEKKKSKKRNKEKHNNNQKHHRQQSKGDNKQYLQDPQHSQQRKMTPSDHLNRLNKDFLKNLPSSQGIAVINNKSENSVYSSASKMRQQQLQAAKAGFRRYPEDAEVKQQQEEQRIQEKQIKPRKEEASDDSFDINDDFQIINVDKESVVKHLKDQSQVGRVLPSRKVINERNNTAALIQHRRAADSSEDDEDDEDLYKPYVAPEKSNYSENHSKHNVQQQQQQQQSVRNVSARDYKQHLKGNSSIQDESELVALGQAAMEEDSVIFCISCEEYIQVEKVDEHSEVCQLKRDNRSGSFKEYIQNVNEKLIKIRFLIKNKHNHLLSFSRNTKFKEGLGLFQKGLELISLSIENDNQIDQLDNLIAELKSLNRQLATNEETAFHSLLYLSQKAIEFVQRKREFISSRQVNDRFDVLQEGANNRIIPSEPSQTSQGLNNYQNYGSYPSQNFRQGSNFSKQKRKQIQIFNKIDNDLDNIKPKLWQQPNSNNVQLSSPQNIIISDKSNQDAYVSFSSNNSYQNEIPNRQQQQTYQNQLSYQEQQQSSYPASFIQIQPQSYQQQQNNIQTQTFSNQEQLLQQQQQKTLLSSSGQQQNSHPFSVRNQQAEERVTVENNRLIEKPRQQQQERSVNEPFLANPQRQQLQQQQQQPFSQKVHNFIEPIETVTVKEAQIVRTSNQRNTQLVSEPFDLSSLTRNQINLELAEQNSQGLQRQRFFQLAHSLKPNYPQSNKFLIADLWNDVKQNQIAEGNWSQFLIQKFS